MRDGKVRWGFIGTGWIADKFANALKVVDNSELYAIGSRSKETAERFAKKFKAQKAYGSYEEVALDSEVDVVYIATPHNLHYENTMMCLEHGKNVLCEKPFAVNGKEVREMITKAKGKNLFLMEAFWSRYLPNIIKAKEIVDSGEIGRVKYLSASFTVKSEQTLEMRHFNKDLIGGALMDIGIYNVFLALYMLGAPQEIKTSAVLGVTEVDESISTIFNYKDVIATLNSSLVVDSPTVAEIHGEKGKILLEHMWFCPGKIHVVYSGGKKVTIPFKFKSNGYNYEAEEVVRCLLEGKKQSALMNWNASLQLIDTLDTIRKQCGIVYPKHDLK